MISPETLPLIFAAFFASAFLKGITGLGFSTICLGLLASGLDIKLAIPLVLLPSLSSNALVMCDAGHFREAWDRVWPMCLAAIPGVCIGLWLLGSLDAEAARRVLGAVLAGYGIYALLNPSTRVSSRVERRLKMPVGFAGGVVNGLTGSQVGPLPYVLSLGLPPAQFVQAINISFTVSSLVMLVGLGTVGLWSVEIAATSALGILPVALGIRLGGMLRRRLPEMAFKYLVLVLLVLLGVNLVARG